MLPEIVTFNKSMQFRLQEYQQLFENEETSCSEVTDIWGSVFEELVVFEADWHALWMLSEGNCRKYDLLYPTAVIVNVNDFNARDLSANVNVLAVQEDIMLPLNLDVPIIELHPLKVQNFDETYLKDIEDWLDKCRYFFRNLWYPWDAKFNVNMMDWCESHLRNRLKMQYDMKNGVFGKTITNYLKSLLSEAHSINDISDKSFCQDEVDERLIVVKKYIRRKIVKAELELFEEPDLRYGMILLKKKAKRLRDSIEKSNDKEAKFVWMNGTCDSLIEHLKTAQMKIDENIPLKVCGSLQEALDSSNTNDTIILPPGIHSMTLLRGIENGGVIKGLSRIESIIEADMSSISRAILFECFGSVELNNLTISKPSGIVLQVFEGSVKITNCRITSKNNSTSRGIVVISGCKLYLEDCELQGFGTGIALQANTFASVSNTKIFNCHEGIKLTGNASLSLQNVEISSCSTFGIRIESSDIKAEVPLVGDLNLIEQSNLPCKINLNSVVLEDNRKGNVIIKKTEKMFSVEQDSCNEIICISDEDESEGSVDDLEITS